MLPLQEQTELVLGRGELYFDRFAPGTTEGNGELYFGNTSGFRIGREIKRLSRSTSYGGQVHELPGALISESHSAIITTDHVSIENLSIWFGGTVKVEGVQAIGDQTERMRVWPGRFYQLGKTIVPMLGVRGLDSLVVRRTGGGLVAQAGNYEVDLETGRIFILADTTGINEGQALDFTFSFASDAENYIAPYPTLIGDGQEIYGSLRFVPRQKVGRHKRYFFPYVRIAPRGQVDLKGDEFQQWSFDVTALRMSGEVAPVYVEDSVDHLAPLTADRVLALNGVDQGQFVIIDDEFDYVINTIIPSRGY